MKYKTTNVKTIWFNVEHLTPTDFDVLHSMGTGRLDNFKDCLTTSNPNEQEITVELWKELNPETFNFSKYNLSDSFANIVSIAVQDNCNVIQFCQSGFNYSWLTNHNK